MIDLGAIKARWAWLLRFAEERLDTRNGWHVARASLSVRQITDVRDLLAEVERLRGEVERLRSERDELVSE